SYTANPTACSAALASLDLMEDEKTWTQIKLIETQHQIFKTKIEKHKRLKDVRVLGTIIAFELNTEEHTHYLNNASQNITEYFLQRGVLLRPLGNIFYIIPPYVIKKEELNVVYSVIEHFLNEN